MRQFSCAKTCGQKIFYWYRKIRRRAICRAGSLKLTTFHYNSVRGAICRAESCLVICGWRKNKQTQKANTIPGGWRTVLEFNSTDECEPLIDCRHWLPCGRRTAQSLQKRLRRVSSPLSRWRPWIFWMNIIRVRACASLLRLACPRAA